MCVGLYHVPGPGPGTRDPMVYNRACLSSSQILPVASRTQSDEMPLFQGPVWPATIPFLCDFISLLYSSLAILTALLFLGPTSRFSGSGYLHLLLPFPGTLFPQLSACFFYFRHSLLTEAFLGTLKAKHQVFPLPSLCFLYYSCLLSAVPNWSASQLKTSIFVCFVSWQQQKQENLRRLLQ